MLETTHIAGDPPDFELVYALRRSVLEGVDLLDMFRLITEHQCTPDGEIRHLALMRYIILAFGGASKDFVDLKLLLHRIAREGDSFTTCEPDIAERVASNIMANRAMWCDKLGGPSVG